MSTEPTSVRTLSPGLLACLVAAPALAVVTRLVAIPISNTPIDYIPAVTASPGRSDLGAVLALVTAVLFIPAALAVGRLVRPRTPRLAAVGTTLFVIGAVAMAALATLTGVAGQLARHGDLSSNSALWVRIWNDSVLAKTWLALLAGAMGCIVLAVGTSQRPGVARVTAPLLGIGGALTVITAAGPAKSLNVAAALVTVTAFALLARSDVSPAATQTTAADGTRPAMAAS